MFCLRGDELRVDSSLLPLDPSLNPSQSVLPFSSSSHYHTR